MLKNYGHELGEKHINYSIFFVLLDLVLKSIVHPP